jgi:hypothetical protein
MICKNLNAEIFTGRGFWRRIIYNLDVTAIERNLGGVLNLSLVKGILIGGPDFLLKTSEGFSQGSADFRDFLGTKDQENNAENN